MLKFFPIMVLSCLAAPVAAQHDSAAAADLFQDYCSVCHGEYGDGQSRARFGLTPPPTDFTQPGLKQSLSAESMIQTVTFGRPGTAMVSWSTRLSQQEITSIVEYIRREFMRSSAESDQPEPPPAAGTAGAPKAKPESVTAVGNFDQGLLLYAQNCVACHGLDGEGDGPRADFIFPKPRDFTRGVPLSREQLYIRIRDGIVGKEMPAWGKVMTEQQMRDVAEYVHARFVQPRASE